MAAERPDFLVFFKNDTGCRVGINGRGFKKLVKRQATIGRRPRLTEIQLSIKYLSVRRGRLPADTQYVFIYPIIDLHYK